MDEKTRELVENLRRYSKGKGLTPREAEQAADAIEALARDAGRMRKALEQVRARPTMTRKLLASEIMLVEMLAEVVAIADAALAPAKELGGGDR